MENEVAKPNEGGVPARADQFDHPLGMLDDGIGPSTPYYSIEYEPTGDQKKGLITLPGGSQVEYVRSVLIATHHIGRAWLPPYDPGAKDQAPPLCFSDPGGVVPVGGDDMQNVENCTKCIHSQWDEIKKGKPPVCIEHVETLEYDLERNRPFLWDFKRKARTMLTGAKEQMANRQGEVAGFWESDGIPANLFFSVLRRPLPEGIYWLPSLMVEDELLSKEKALEMLVVWDELKDRFLSRTIADAMKQEEKERDEKSDDGLPDQPPF